MEPLGVFHVACAVSSMILGAVIFFITKGTRLHVYLGRAYVATMLGLNVTALLIYRLFGGFGAFHVFAIISLITLIFGVTAVWTRRPADRWLSNHYHGMGWSYVGLIAAGVSESIVRVRALREFIHSWMNFGIAVFVASIIVCLIGGWLIAKFERKSLGGLQHARAAKLPEPSSPPPSRD